MKRIGTILLFLALAFIAFLFVYPVTYRHPGVPRHMNEMRSLESALQQYHAEYGNYPTGSIDYMVSALQGDNPRKLLFLEWLRPTSGRDRGATDPWGTPYDIAIDDTNITISTAGPDKRFGTADDKKVE